MYCELMNEMVLHPLKLHYSQEKNKIGGMKLLHRPREALAAACVIVVCRFKHISRTEKEILAVCSCTRKHLAVVLRGVNRVVYELSKRRVPVSTSKV